MIATTQHYNMHNPYCLDVQQGEMDANELGDSETESDSSGKQIATTKTLYIAMHVIIIPFNYFGIQVMIDIVMMKFSAHMNRTYLKSLRVS